MSSGQDDGLLISLDRTLAELGYVPATQTVTVEAGAEITHKNLNDGSVEGFTVPRLRAFAVQHHPEAAPGPHDALHLFERMIRLVEAD